MKEIVSERKIEVLTVEEPRMTFKMFTQTGGSIFGLVLAGFGVLLMLTIIGILPGIGAVIIGLVIAVMNAPKTPIVCPACGLETSAPLKSKKLECESCATITPLRWVKSNNA